MKKSKSMRTTKRGEERHWVQIMQATKGVRGKQMRQGKEIEREKVGKQK